MTSPLHDEVRALLRAAYDRARRESDRELLLAARERLAEPVRLAVVGPCGSGKSVLVNALVEHALVPTAVRRPTRVVTEYRYGDDYGAELVDRAGSPVGVPVAVDGGVHVDLGPRRARDVRRLAVRAPVDRLRTLTVLDTPGSVDRATVGPAPTGPAGFPQSGGVDEPGAPPADAVLHLLPHREAWAAQVVQPLDGDHAPTVPLTSVGVVSRADELGSCRLDAMAVARGVAERYGADPLVAGSCSAVVAVAGLLAQGAPLPDDAYADLVDLASGPGERLASLLATADDLVADAGDVPVPVGVRRRLLDRLGLFGVRAAVELVRAERAPDPAALERALVRLSGVVELRDVVRSRVVDRGDVLTARTAIATVGGLVRAGRLTDAGAVIGAAQRVVSGSQEFRELEQLERLRTGGVPVDPGAAEELARLLGGAGVGASRRLGLGFAAPDAECRSEASAARSRWRRVADPRSGAPAPVRRAAETAVRSCQALLEGLGGAGAPRERPGLR